MEKPVTKTINIDKELHKEVALEAVKRGIRIKALVETAIRVYLDSNRQRETEC